MVGPLMDDNLAYSGMLSVIKEELHTWELVGARGLAHILAQLPVG
jgi:hypothetical protein